MAVNSLTEIPGRAGHDGVVKKAAVSPAMNPKADPSNPMYEMLQRGERRAGGEPAGVEFDLRVTLQETEVRETSYAEFLELLKKSGRQAA